MSDFAISSVYPGDKRMLAQVDELLVQEGLNRDGNLDYICAMIDENGRVIGTGSCFGNTLRCFAVSRDHQGEGLMNEIISHLMQFQAERGNLHLFVYTKCQSAKFFSDLGFYEIARVEDKLVFMENRRKGFSAYLSKLVRGDAAPERTAALVMNANPFTRGHLYLATKAAEENDVLHLFIVSEDAAHFPYAVRKRLVMEGTAHLKNIIYHDSGPYIISRATFPSYFLKEASAVIEGQARLDLAVFGHIAEALGIGRRYVGEEPTSVVTGLYNQIMREELPKAGIACTVIPRLAQGGAAISASTVRALLQGGDMKTIRDLVPESTYRYLTSEEAAPVLERIRAAGDVRHY